MSLEQKEAEFEKSEEVDSHRNKVQGATVLFENKPHFFMSRRLGFLRVRVSRHSRSRHKT
jgi:hypothetical protein